MQFSGLAKKSSGKASPVAHSRPELSVSTALPWREIGNDQEVRRCACGGAPAGDLGGFRVSRPTDPSELEADRVASQLSPTNPAIVHRKCTACERGEQMAGNPSEMLRAVVNAPGETLPDAERRFFEARLGRSLDNVRVHTDSQASQSARAINARAYTVGNHVVFGNGEYHPATADGRHLLAHELVHVAQQTGAGSNTAIHRDVDDGTDDGQGETTSNVVNTPNLGETVPEQPVEESSGPGPSGGKPDPSIPDCTAVMGGRQVDYWAAKIIKAQHTFMNFKLDSANYWLVEGGPLPGSPKTTGAWAKFGDWDTRGERVRKMYGPEDCAAVKDCLLSNTATYHSKALPYDPTSGPNSNSFMEQLTFKCGTLPRKFISNDIAWDYWTTRTRPF